MLRRLLLTLTFAVGLWPSSAVPQERRPVDKADITVWDGDTIRTKVDGRIRLRTCNAPEFLSPGRPAALRATERLIALIDGAESAALVCKWEPACRDGYGRLICDLMLDGRDACEALIVYGLADKETRMRPCSRW